MTLTRDEILAMTPDQLRVEIAKRKGWKVWIRNYRDLVLPPTEDGGTFVIVNGFEGGNLQWGSKESHWPTSIADAWELVEEMRLAHIYVGVEVNIDGWLVDAIKSIESRESSLIIVGQPTAPLAISRAWLLWHEERKEEK